MPPRNSGVPPDPKNRTRNSGVPSESDADLIIKQGYFLPHWRLKGATYHVVFRQQDAVPAHIFSEWLEERTLLAQKAKCGELSEAEHRRLIDLQSDTVDKYLDAGHGSCLFRDPKLAAIVDGALRFFHGQRYFLYAWSVMPNHTHAVVEPLADFDLSSITHSWKSFTSHQVNKVLARSGENWHKESFDRIIRNKDEFESTCEYVLNNPVAIGLSNWPFAGFNAPTP